METDILSRIGLGVLVCPQWSVDKVVDKSSNTPKATGAHGFDVIGSNANEHCWHEYPFALATWSHKLQRTRQKDERDIRAFPQSIEWS